jgi:hypothetical protein
LGRAKVGFLDQSYFAWILRKRKVAFYKFRKNKLITKKKKNIQKLKILLQENRNRYPKPYL